MSSGSSTPMSLPIPRRVLNFTPQSAGATNAPAATPFSTDRPAADSAVFAEIVAGIVHNAVRSVKKEYLSRDLRTLFSSHAATDDESFLLLEDSDLPDAAPLTANPDWDTLNSLTVPPVRKALMKIKRAVEILGGTNQYLQEGVKFADVQSVIAISDAGQIGRPGSSEIATSRGSKRNEDWKPLKFDTFSGKPEDFSQWKEHVELVFKQHGVAQFITDSSVCDLHPDQSSSYVGSLQLAIKESCISAKAEKNKDKTCFEFYKSILDSFDSEVLLQLNQFSQWTKLFTLSLQSIDDAREFKNRVETIIQKLEKRSSPGLTDKALMRALISRSVTCETLDEVMHQVQIDTAMEVDEILVKIEEKCTAIKARESLTNTTSGAVTSGTVRRGGTTKTPSAADNSGDKAKRPWRIPPLPANLKDYVHADVLNNLKTWRAQMNNCTYNSVDKGKADHFKIRANPKCKYPGNGSQGGNDRDQGRGGSRNHRRHDDRQGKYGRRGERSEERSFSRSRSRSRSRSNSRSHSVGHSRSQRSSSNKQNGGASNSRRGRAESPARPANNKRSASDRANDKRSRY